MEITAELETTETDNSPPVIDVQNNAAKREGLALWHKVSLRNVRGYPFDLSARQMALLLTLYIEDTKQHSVKSLAAYLDISKPAVCRALDTLSRHNLAERVVDQKDRRNVFIHLTEIGLEFLSRLSKDIVDSVWEIQ